MKTGFAYPPSPGQWLLLWTAALVGLGQLSAAASESPGSRWALLIGVDDYANLEKLKYAGADMRALQDQLVASGFPGDQIFLLHNKAEEARYQPFRANIERQLELILGLVEKNDLVVVGFSGHGVHLDDKSYLCPSEARLDDPATLVALDTVYQRLNKCPASLKVLLVDACRNDPRPGGQRAARLSSGVLRFAESLESPPRGIMLFTSCMPGEISMEEKEFGHGVFMHFVIEGMKGRADLNHNGRLSLFELCNYASDATKVYVARTYNDSQRPLLRAETPDFDFAEIPGRLHAITNSIGMKLVFVPAGGFMMGASGSTDSDHTGSDEQPRHHVEITRPFHMGQHEVTVGQFRRFVESSGYETEAEWNGAGGYGLNTETGRIEGPDPKYT